MKVKAKIDAGFPAKPWLFTPARKREIDVDKFEGLRTKFRDMIKDKLNDLVQADFNDRKNYLTARDKIKQSVSEQKNKALQTLFSTCVWLPVEEGNYGYTIKKGEEYEHADELRAWDLFEYPKAKGAS